MHLVQKIHAVMLAGGSAFGLDAASGAMRFLEEGKIGFPTGVVKVPIVASAISSTSRSDSTVRPDSEMGYGPASKPPPPSPRGKAGAGKGCTVGKIFGGPAR